MNNRDTEIRKQIHAAIDGNLSHLEVNPSLRCAILDKTRGEEPMKRKISAGVVLAIALLLAMAAIGVAATRFGALEFNRDQAENEVYAAHILAVDETYENEYLTMTLNDAVFDGVSLSVTMDISGKEGAQPVFVQPILTASANGRTLIADPEACRGSFFVGFWIGGPYEETGVEGQYGADYAIITEDETSGVTYDPQKDPVTWSLSFAILRPAYPTEEAGLRLPDGGDAENRDFETYTQQFAQAYAQKRILLADGSPMDYMAILPRPEDMEDEAWWRMPMADKLVSCGAFALVDSPAFEFTTQETDVKTLSAPKTFDLGDTEVTVTKLTLSFSRCDYELDVSKKPGAGKSAVQLYADGEEQWLFAVLADGCQTAPQATSVGMEEDGRVHYSGSVSLDGKTDSVTFVPCRCARLGSIEHFPDSEVYSAQRPVTPEQEALAFAVKAE